MLICVLNLQDSVDYSSSSILASSITEDGSSITDPTSSFKPPTVNTSPDPEPIYAKVNKRKSALSDDGGNSKQTQTSEGKTTEQDTRPTGPEEPTYAVPQKRMSSEGGPRMSGRGSTYEARHSPPHHDVYDRWRGTSQERYHHAGSGPSNTYGHSVRVEDAGRYPRDNQTAINKEYFDRTHTTGVRGSGYQERQGRHNSAYVPEYQDGMGQFPAAGVHSLTRTNYPTDSQGRAGSPTPADTSRYEPEVYPHPTYDDYQQPDHPSDVTPEVYFQKRDPVEDYDEGENTDDGIMALGDDEPFDLIKDSENLPPVPFKRLPIPSFDPPPPVAVDQRSKRNSPVLAPKPEATEGHRVTKVFVPGNPQEANRKLVEMNTFVRGPEAIQRFPVENAIHFSDDEDTQSKVASSEWSHSNTQFSRSIPGFATESLDERGQRVYPYPTPHYAPSSRSTRYGSFASSRPTSYF